MNVIIFTSSSNKSGGSRQALYLAQGLHQQGHNVVFLHPDNATIVNIAPHFPCCKKLGPKKDWRSAIEACFPTDGSGCIVHAFHNAAVKKVSWWGLFWKKKAVVVAHRGVIFRPNNPLPYWSSGIACFLVNSQKCYDVLRSLWVSKSRLCVVPNAVPDARVTPKLPAAPLQKQLGITSQHFVFGTVANDSPVKGVKELLDAFAVAAPSAPYAQLLIIGVNPAIWLPECDARNITSQVILLDHIEDVASYLALMNAFILPSLSESMPNTLLEAVRMGLPSISTDVGSAAEIIENCGIVVPAGNSEKLAEAIKAFLQNPDIVAQYSEQALVQSQKYIPAVRLRRIEHIYTTLLTQRGFI